MRAEKGGFYYVYRPFVNAALQILQKGHTLRCLAPSYSSK